MATSNIWIPAPSQSMKDDKYCGGMDITMDIDNEASNQSLVLPKYSGLRLINPKNNCFVHVSINAIVTNKDIMAEVNDPRPFNKWYRATLLEHKPYCNIQSLPQTVEEIELEIHNFFHSSGCADAHGKECFERLKKQYLHQLKMQSVVQEIKNLVAPNQAILSATTLKRKLSENFPNVKSYRSDDQDDASTPFFHIVECLTNLCERFHTIIRKKHRCLECGREGEWREDSLWCQLICSGGKSEHLQTKIDEWCNNTSELEKLCDCKLYINGIKVVNEKTVDNTRHEVVQDVIKASKLLYIRTRDRIR